MDLSIPGLNVNLKKHQPISLKLTWLLTFLVCIFVCFKQLVNRVDYFYTYPVDLIYSFESDESIDFPKITFCPTFPKFLENVSNDETDANLTEMMWNAFDKPFSHFISDCDSDTADLDSEPIDCFNAEYWTTRLSVFGAAHTFNYATLSRLKNSWNIRMSTKMKDVESWRILIHDDYEDIIYGCLTASHVLEKEHLNLYNFLRKQFEFENVPTRPCLPIKTFTRCIQDCLHYKMLNGIGCKLPFMTSLTSLPLCTDWKLVRNIYNQFTSTFNLLYLSDCNCSKSCYENQLEIDLATRELENVTVISVFFAVDEIERFEEARNYIFHNLFCDTGGIVGLFIGACALTLIEFIQNLSKIVYRKYRQPIGKPMIK
ncbi:hypothetical protein CHUAL_012367 [Chamberlinius hualienensis]